MKNRRQPKTTPTSAEASAHDKNRCPESGTGEKDKQLASAVCKQRFGYNWCLMVGNVHVASTDSLFVFPHITMWGSNFLLAIRRRPPARPPVRPSVRPPPPAVFSILPLSHWSVSIDHIDLHQSIFLYQLLSINLSLSHSSVSTSRGRRGTCWLSVEPLDACLWTLGRREKGWSK